MNMLDVSILTIVLFIVKIIIALALVFYGSLFLYGLLRLMVERSNGSIFKMLLKLVLLIGLGGVLAYYLGEAVSHFFGEGKQPTAGGIVGLLLLAIYALGELIGDLYVSASIFAFILWCSLIYYVVIFLFGTSKEVEKKENKARTLSDIERNKKEVEEGIKAYKELQKQIKKQRSKK